VPEQQALEQSPEQVPKQGQMQRRWMDLLPVSQPHLRQIRMPACLGCLR